MHRLLQDTSTTFNNLLFSRSNVQKCEKHCFLLGYRFSEETNHKLPAPSLGWTIGRLWYLGRIGTQTNWSVGHLMLDWQKGLLKRMMGYPLSCSIDQLLRNSRGPRSGSEEDEYRMKTNICAVLSNNSGDLFREGWRHGIFFIILAVWSANSWGQRQGCGREGDNSTRRNHI